MSETIDNESINTDRIAKWLDSGSVNLFGLPFAGKDSQAHRLSKRFGGPVISGGDILRNSVIPPRVKALIEAGQLAPTDDYTRIVLPYLSREKFAGRPLFLSSVGRWHGEEESVMVALERAEHPLRAVVHLPLSEEIVMERLNLEENEALRGTRADDDAEKLLKRIEEFNVKTLPVIERYRDLGYLIEVDASLPKDEVEQHILGGLALRAANA